MMLKNIVISLNVCAVLFCFGCNSTNERKTTSPQSSPGTVADKSVLLATMETIDKPSGVVESLSNKTDLYIDINKLGAAAVYVSGQPGKLKVVHNGKSGKYYKNITNVRLSPDGQRITYVTHPYDNHSQMVVDHREVGPFFDDISEPTFSADSRNLAYRVSKGTQMNLVINGKISKSFEQYPLNPVFSADSRFILYGEGSKQKNKSNLVISDLLFNKLHTLEGCGAAFVVNADATRVATVCEEVGKKRVVDFTFNSPQTTTAGASYNSISNLSYSRQSNTFSYVAERGGASYLVLNGKEEKLPKGTVVADPVIRPHAQEAGIIISSMEGVYLHQVFKTSDQDEARYDMVDSLAYSNDGKLHAYAAFKNESWRIVVNGKEGPAFDRAIGPVFSPDDKYLVYRARQDGKRFLVVADTSVGTIRQHQAYDMVYPPVFTADGTSVAYGAKLGRELWWKVENLLY